MTRIGKRKYIRQRKRGDNTLNTHYLASCYGKIRYEKTDKERALEGKPDSVHFYKCRYCKWCHIGKRRSDS